MVVEPRTDEHLVTPDEAGPSEQSADRAAAQSAEQVVDQSAELVDLLHALLHHVRRESVGQTATPTLGQLRFLRTLARCGGAQRPGELAARLDLAPRSVTSKVDLAEAAGLVERRADPADRRATLVALTDLGRAALDRSAADRAEGMAHRLDRLSAAERVTLVALLRRLAEAQDEREA